MKKILVVGAQGQLGNCLQKVARRYSSKYSFDFVDSVALDITDDASVHEYIQDLKPDFCINAAAYTAVDLAEKETEKAYAVNAYGVFTLAEACRNVGAVFIHISTDYVFDGETEISYSEENFAHPLGVYGASKLKGEELALENHDKTIVLRTSWLYSEFNKNFVKTMLSLFETQDELKIVNDQYGQPTNANDLAEAIMAILESENKVFGIFHFSNYPETTWFHFAEKIAEFSLSSVNLTPVSTAQYRTPARRPRRSTMDLDKIERVYGIVPKYWEHSLEECIMTLKNWPYV